MRLSHLYLLKARTVIKYDISFERWYGSHQSLHITIKLRLVRTIYLCNQLVLFRSKHIDLCTCIYLYIYCFFQTRHLKSQEIALYRNHDGYYNHDRSIHLVDVLMVYAPSGCLKSVSIPCKLYHTGIWYGYYGNNSYNGMVYPDKVAISGDVLQSAMEITIFKR